MKYKYKKLLCCICMLFLLPLSTVSIRAYSGADIPVLLDEEESDNGDDFISQALRSLDEETAQEEEGENYLTNFYNSTQTASSKSFSIFHPETWIMAVINLFTLFSEMIGALMTFFTMVLYNFVSSSFLGSVVNSVIIGIESVVFDWQDMNSWVIKALVISTLVGIIYRLVKEFTHIRGYKQMLMIALSAVMSMTFVIFIGRNGRNIISGFENALQSTIVETFVFDGEAKNMEIANKESIFNTMQMQPFMLRHYGTTSYEQIAKNSGQSVDEAKARVQELLDDPSTDNAEKEYEEYENKAISHDIISSGAVFFLSLITLIHKVLVGVIIAVICMAVGVVKLMKELLLWLSVYQLIWWMIKRDHKAQQWFADRIMWSILAIGADLLFSTALYFIMQMCTKVSAIHPLFLIAFDALLLVILLFAKKHIGEIAAWLKNTGGDAIKTMLVGSSTPLQFYNAKSKHSGYGKDNNAPDNEAPDDSNDQITNDEDLSDTDSESDDQSGEDLSDKAESSDDHDEKTEDTGADENDPDQSGLETGDEDLTEKEAEEEEKDHQEDDPDAEETSDVEVLEDDADKKHDDDHEELSDEDVVGQTETENMNLSEEDTSDSADDDDEDLSDKEEIDLNDPDPDEEAADTDENELDQSETEATEVIGDAEDIQDERNINPLGKDDSSEFDQSEAESAEVAGNEKADASENIQDEENINHLEKNDSSEDRQDHGHEDNPDKFVSDKSNEADESVLEVSDPQ